MNTSLNRKAEKSKKEASNKHRHETYNFYGFCYGVQVLGGIALKYDILTNVNRHRIVKWMVSKNIPHLELLDKFRAPVLKSKQVLKKTSKKNKEPYYQSVRRYCTMILTWVDESRSKNRYDYVVHKLNTFKVDVAEIKVEVAEIKMAMVEDRKVF
ncbi:hypothetical protein WN944_018491 [Citrus x changshan-huyou]|uniref:Uncharacterized protein n=1 Tax=Citrus x changshan-huyou TaxID=2935761 RepID=A0AAP0QIK3_9ROSI